MAGREGLVTHDGGDNPSTCVYTPHKKYVHTFKNTTSENSINHFRFSIFHDTRYLNNIIICHSFKNTTLIIIFQNDQTLESRNSRDGGAGARSLTPSLHESLIHTTDRRRLLGLVRLTPRANSWLWPNFLHFKFRFSYLISVNM